MVPADRCSSVRPVLSEARLEARLASEITAKLVLLQRATEAHSPVGAVTRPENCPAAERMRN